MQELMDRRVVRLLGGSLQPAELAHALARAMDGGVAGGVAPSQFRLLLHPEDYADLRAVDRSLERKLAAYAVELARERGWNFASPPRVHLAADAEVERGRARVQAEPVEAVVSAVNHGVRSEVRWKRPASVRFEVAAPEGLVELPLDHFPFSIGRRPGSDLVLPDPRVSRDHAVVEAAGGGWRLRDLGSRNGTIVNGQPVSEADLRDGDRIAIGGFEVTARIERSA